MSRKQLDHERVQTPGRMKAFTRLDRIRAGEASHPNIRLLTRRGRKGRTDASIVKQFLRIDRGYLA
ncbi:hypothetical protein [Psychromarinibacter sp. S121]|uniref:hypothetical protein n=1 Tax=Psychromarinibacter sp. S121 TaxID=3415127 RepID=UPI003C7AB1A9